MNIRLMYKYNFTIACKIKIIKSLNNNLKVHCYIFNYNNNNEKRLINFFINVRQIYPKLGLNSATN